MLWLRPKAKLLQTPTSMEAEEFDCAMALANIGVDLDTTQSQKLQEAQAAHRQKQRSGWLPSWSWHPEWGPTRPRFVSASAWPGDSTYPGTADRGGRHALVPKVTSEALQASLQD